MSDGSYDPEEKHVKWQEY